MINISDSLACSGCTACASVCKFQAISMEPDALGFLYPKVDGAKCVDCGLCNNVCAFQAPDERRQGWPQTYLMQHVNPCEVLKSKSGGAFVVLSDVILQHGGVVYGVKLNREYLAEHDSATTPLERDLFRGSKYIQSDIQGVFAKVKADLKEGKTVLFSGTPCQVAGLKAFIDERFIEKLYLIDILCHGVASPAIWKDYLHTIESQKKKKIQRCIPRDPKLGWDNSIDTFFFEDGTQYSSDYFTGYVYHKWITLRMSCSVCPFTSLNRVSDITIGDAWGAKKVEPEFDKDNLGGSIILVNTEKGRTIFKTAKSNMVVVPVDINKMMQPVLKSPTKFHPKRKALEDAYSKYGYTYVKFVYLNNTVVAVKTVIRRFLSQVKYSLIR